MNVVFQSNFYETQYTEWSFNNGLSLPVNSRRSYPFKQAILHLVPQIPYILSMMEINSLEQRDQQKTIQQILTSK